MYLLTLELERNLTIQVKIQYIHKGYNWLQLLCKSNSVTIPLICHFWTSKPSVESQKLGPRYLPKVVPPSNDCENDDANKLTQGKLLN